VKRSPSRRGIAVTTIVLVFFRDAFLLRNLWNTTTVLAADAATP